MAAVRMGARTAEVLAAIREHIGRRGYPPSVRELCAACGLASTSAVHYHLERLEALGLIVRGPRRSRAIAVLPRIGGGLEEPEDMAAVGQEEE